MILGSRKVFLRHVLVACISFVVITLYFFSHFSQDGFKVALLKALADSAFTFLFITLSIGPLGVLWEPALRFLKWRREFGIWFAIIALFHGLFAAGLYFNWNIMGTFSQGGLGLSNLLGATALFFALILAATSSDRAVKFLGIGSWKWLHNLSYVIFYLAGAHATYNLFIKSQIAANLFRYIFPVMFFAVLIAQLSAFLKIVLLNRRRLKEGMNR